MFSNIGYDFLIRVGNNAVRLRNLKAVDCGDCGDYRGDRHTDMPSSEAIRNAMFRTRSICLHPDITKLHETISPTMLCALYLIYTHISD